MCIYTGGTVPYRYLFSIPVLVAVRSFVYKMHNALSHILNTNYPCAPPHSLKIFKTATTVCDNPYRYKITIGD